MLQGLFLKNTKSIISTLFFFVFIFNINVCFAAQNLNNAFEPKGPLDQAAGDKGAGYITTGVSVESQISLIINTVLSLIGVIFLILAIYAGFKWMTAAGNEEAVDKAKNTIINATIGLIVVLAAYAISWFIINILGRAVFKT